MLLQGTACPRATPAARVQVAVLCAAHTHEHTSYPLSSTFILVQGSHFSLFRAFFTLKPARQVLLRPCREACFFASLLLCIWLLDHLAVFTLGIPAVRESLLGKGARTGLSCKGWASCWSDGLTHTAWYSQSQIFSVLSLRGTKIHTRTIPAAFRPPGTREP